MAREMFAVQPGTGARGAMEGLPVDELDTPCLLVDLDRLERNIQRWQAEIEAHGVSLRAHIKTHKVPDIALAQLEAGAKGIAAAKVSEAEVFAAHGCRDIVIAYPVIGTPKWERIAALAGDGTAVTVNVDSDIAALGLSTAAAARGVTVGVQIEIDTGFHRCGFDPIDIEGIKRLADFILSLPGLELDGITTHRGVFFDGSDVLSVEQAGHAEGEQMVALAGVLRAAGLPVPEVTAGGTITGRAVAAVKGITEVRAGTYVFNDLMQIGFGSAREEDLALTVLCTVVSHQTSDRATVDGGSKTFSGDRGFIGGGSTPDAGLARALGRDIVLERMSEEHGMVRIGDDTVTVGEKVAFVPTHACTCVNLSDELVGIRGGHVERVWPILARGHRT